MKPDKAERALNFLIGQVLTALPTANPRIVRQLIEDRLDAMNAKDALKDRVE